MDCVYMITNKHDGKFYIGSGSTLRGELQKRIKKHLSCARTGNPAPLYEAIRKECGEYITDANFRNHFRVTILETGVDGYTLESKWIKKLDACNPEVGYNLSHGEPGKDKKRITHKVESDYKQQSI